MKKFGFYLKILSDRNILCIITFVVKWVEKSGLEFGSEVLLYIKMGQNFTILFKQLQIAQKKLW